MVDSCTEVIATHIAHDYRKHLGADRNLDSAIGEAPTQKANVLAIREDRRLVAQVGRFEDAALAVQLGGVDHRAVAKP